MCLTYFGSDHTYFLSGPQIFRLFSYFSPKLQCNFLVKVAGIFRIYNYKLQWTVLCLLYLDKMFLFKNKQDIIFKPSKTTWRGSIFEYDNVNYFWKKYKQCRTKKGVLVRKNGNSPVVWSHLWSDEKKMGDWWAFPLFILRFSDILFQRKISTKSV